MSDYIKREDALKMLCKRCNSTCNLDGNCDEMDAINDVPAIDAVPVVRCRDCKYFEYDHFDSKYPIPIITLHEICTKWGGGCKTSENGYCFMGEPKEVSKDV